MPTPPDPLGNECYQERRAYSQAINPYREALRYALEISNRLDEVISLVNLGLVLKETGKLQASIAFFAVSVLILENLSDVPLDLRKPVLAKAFQNLSSLRKAIPDFELVLTDAIANLNSILSEETEIKEYGFDLRDRATASLTWISQTLDIVDQLLDSPNAMA